MHSITNFVGIFTNVDAPLSHRYHTNDIELLFHILRCFTTRFIVQFEFVKDFLDNVVAAVSDVPLHFTIYVLAHLSQILK